MEKTLKSPEHRFRVRKHLHGRGEDFRIASTAASVTETPPRTWRRLVHPQIGLAGGGNTSTDVEKTMVWVSSASIDSRNTSTDVEKSQKAAAD